MAEAYHEGAAARAPYNALDALLTEHGLCRRGLDDPHITEMVVAL